MASGERIGAVLFGGIILGVWIYGLLFHFDAGRPLDIGRWFGWGMVGLAIAGAIYGTRAADDVVRLVMVTVIGIVLSIVVLGAILNENVYILATLTTALGAGLISMALPAPVPADQGRDEGSGGSS